MMASGLLRLLCIHFVSLLTKFDRNLSSGCRENAKKPLKKCIKIGRFQVKFSPRRRRAMKKWMAVQGKEIFRRFRISNQIFGSTYRSRDIARSLDTTLAIFAKNLNVFHERFSHQLCARNTVLRAKYTWWEFRFTFQAMLNSCRIVCRKPLVESSFRWKVVRAQKTWQTNKQTKTLILLIIED